MEVQRFKNHIGRVHELELSRILDVPMNEEVGGIDLIDNRMAVEVKSCLIDSRSSNFKKRYAKWTLFDYQLTWDQEYDVPLYCAVGTYELDSSVSSIRTTNLNRLEKHVTKREFWVVPWDWTMKFPIRVGKHHSYRYLRKNPAANTGIPSMPKTKHGEFIPKGFLHITEGVDMKHFPNL